MDALIDPYYIKVFKGFFLGLTYNDFAEFIGFMAWLAILAFPLTTIDTSDGVSGICYTGSALVIGIIFVLAIPNFTANAEQLQARDNFQNNFIWCSIFVGLSTLRWLNAYVLQTKEIENQQKESDHHGQKLK